MSAAEEQGRVERTPTSARPAATRARDAGSRVPLLLALESSCDETAAAVVRGRVVHASVIASQIEIHARFGGVVPELASRHHLLRIDEVAAQALAQAGISPRDLDAVAVTHAPGLVGALLVAVQYGRGLAAALDVPCVGVHHMEGHVCSPFLAAPEALPTEALPTEALPTETLPTPPPNAAAGAPRCEPFTLPPHLALLVSGGHSELVDVGGLGEYTRLGSTRDDAVGEAFDKVAKLLGLGYPGGPIIDRLARGGDPRAIDFPRAFLDRGLEFSFSGLKTAVLVHVERRGMPETAQAVADLCASFQAAVVDVLVTKVRRARAQTGRDLVTIVGGVAANTALRAAMQDAAARDGFTFLPTPLPWCGDNAAMIGAAAGARLIAGDLARVDVRATLPLDDPRLRVEASP
jgi:N6-L-threonylcarbamoyladenine synthase